MTSLSSGDNVGQKACIALASIFHQLQLVSFKSEMGHKVRVLNHNLIDSNK